MLQHTRSVCVTAYISSSFSGKILSQVLANVPDIKAMLDPSLILSHVCSDLGVSISGYTLQARVGEGDFSIIQTLNKANLLSHY